MNWILAFLGIIGLYIVLGWWTWARHTVAIHALGTNITVFAILFLVGTALILKATVFGK